MDDLAIGGAFGNPVLRFPQNQPVIAGLLDRRARKRGSIAAIGERGVDYVGQEVVNLSTTPVWNDDRLTPRPFVLRVYAARTKNGWSIMPGGFCRISDRADARAVSMGEGVQSADVWVLADKPVEMITLLPTNETARIRRLMGNLPSRAADNLFWLGRYLERVEATLRLIRCLAGRMINTDAETGTDRLDGVQGHRPPRRLARRAEEGRRRSARALRHRPAQRGRITAPPFAGARRAPRRLGHPRAAFGRYLAAASASSSRRSAPTERPLLSEADAYDQVDAALRTIAAISGLAQENMNRGAGWRLFDIGRRVERAHQFLPLRAPVRRPDGALRRPRGSARSRRLADHLSLALSDGRRALRPVRDMVVLDPFNPRSVAFQLERLGEHLESLPVLSDDGMPEKPRRQIVKLAAEVDDRRRRRPRHRPHPRFREKPARSRRSRRGALFPAGSA